MNGRSRGRRIKNPRRDDAARHVSVFRSDYINPLNHSVFMIYLFLVFEGIAGVIFAFDGAKEHSCYWRPVGHDFCHSLRVEKGIAT